jgi:rhodanese-related sulfurtransferase
MDEGPVESQVEEVPETGVEIDPADVLKLAESGEGELIDVRRDYEHEAGHIAGSRQIEMNDLTASAGFIPKDRPVVFYCRGGSRSAMAAEAFSQAGFDAHNMTGGIVAWADQGLPLEPEGGEVVRPKPV